MTTRRFRCTKCGEVFGDLDSEPRGFIRQIAQGAAYLIFVLAHVNESKVGCKPMHLGLFCIHGHSGECSECDRFKRLLLTAISTGSKS